ncbi:MAG: DNA-processing protein DprA [Nitrospiraceae bacterium]|nr:DNA-processing protein DprA [Nitrospiraceae bacterium]
MPGLEYWIALRDVKDIGPVTAKKLLAVYKNPKDVFNASIKELSEIKSVGPKKAKNIKEFDAWKKIDAEIAKLKNSGIQIITINDKDYPENLKAVNDSPIFIYVKSIPEKNDKFALAVVGSRKLTSYGQHITEKLSSELSQMGFTIVSGMARGIDTLAHISALKAGGRTIGVMGSGIDVPYPPENKMLMEKISSSGYVVSEFAPGTPPDKENFPRRNRLISGLSLGVLVVEAVSDSGSLITAEYAKEQKREVFAVPGNINSKNSEGTNQLIRNGAKTVLSAEDIIEKLAPSLKGFIKSKEKAKTELTDEEKRLCDIMTAEPRHVDILSRESMMPSSRVLGILLSLELKGIVKQAEGKKFFLV